jgi:RimJ/RimL family protein N-acetyltransferase
VNPDVTPTWPATTERLTIRPYAPGDLDAVWHYRRRPAVYEWLPADFSDRERFAELMSEPVRLERTLVVERKGTVIGDLYLHVDADWAQREVADRAERSRAEVGWVLDPDHGGQGYATEAAAGLLDLCFEELGVRRATASCFADNVPSWRLMERLGMRREQYGVRDSLHRDRGWLDGVTYALLAEEWRARG